MGHPSPGLGVALLAGLFVLGGCGLLSPTPVVLDTEPKPLDPVEEDRPSPDPEGFTTTLLDAGAEPRQELRYRYVMGTPERTRIVTTREDSGRDYDGTSLAYEGVHTLEVTVTPRRKKALHLIQFDATVDVSSTELSRSDANSRIVAEVRDEALDGGTAQGMYTDRGLGAAINPRYSRIPDAIAAGQVADLWRSIAQLPVPLPVEPVGVGARWTVTQPVELDDGASLDVVETFSLIAFDGGRGSVVGSIQVEATDVSLQVPRLPKGTTVVIEEVAYQSEGVTVFSLDRFAPISSSAEGTSSARFVATLPINGVKRRSQSSEVRMTIEQIEVPPTAE